MNPRYKDLTLGVAGDEDQFFHLLFQSIEKDFTQTESCGSIDCWERYSDRECESVLNTFYYLFYKIKKGVLVRIRDGKVKLFLPFVNKHFKNEWSEQIKAPPGTTISDIIERCTLEQGRRWNPRRLNNNIDGWWANNCLVRYEYPPMETDRNIDTIRNYLDVLCSKEHIEDIDFFLNKRDFPVLKKDGTEPYNHLWGTTQKPLLSHNYEKYAPVFSMVSSPMFADISFTTWDDMEMIKRGKKGDGSLKWDERLPVAIWRGTSTGAGVGVEDNVRIHLSHLSHHLQRPDLDAGITKWNCRPRKLQNSPYLQIIEPSKLNIPLKQWISPEEQQKYKYIIVVDGHVSAFRLSSNLNSGSVVLLVKSDWEVWYDEKIKPWEHYVPVKKDLSDLIEKIEWCKSNDSEVFLITQRAKNLCHDIFNTNHYKIIADKINKYSNPYKDPIQHFTKIRQYCITPPPTTKPLSLKINMDTCTRIFNGKLSNVYDTGKGVIIKTSNNERKTIEHKNELFVGTECINILNSPNFVKTLGWYKDGTSFNIVSKYVEGITLQGYISSDTFNFKDFKNILAQISLSVIQAQEKYGFIHWDLTPWNIMIKQNTEHVDLTYNLYNGDGFALLENPKYIAVIIDFGKSRVIKNGKFRGYINIFSSCPHQDTNTILLTSLKEIICNRSISGNEWFDFNHLLKLVFKEQMSCKKIKSELYKLCNYQNLTTRTPITIRPLTLFYYLNCDYKIVNNTTIINPTKFILHHHKDDLINLYQLQLYEISGGEDTQYLDQCETIFKNMKLEYTPTICHKTPYTISSRRLHINSDFFKTITTGEQTKNMFWMKYIINSILTYPKGKKLSLPHKLKARMKKWANDILNTPGILLHHDNALFNMTL